MHSERLPEHRRFASPEEELVYLRKHVAQQERALEARGMPQSRESLIQERVAQYRSQKPEAVLQPDYQLSSQESRGITADLAPEAHDSNIKELLSTLRTRGVRNTFSVLDQLDNPHLEDDFHRALIQYIRSDIPLPDIKERDPLWQPLHMTLFEISLPESQAEHSSEKPLKELLSSLEQFYAGMLSLSQSNSMRGDYFVLELALPNDSSEITFYAAVPNERRGLFEKQLHSIFPNATLYEQKNDYNIFIDGGDSVGAHAVFSRNPIYPLKTYEEFDYDPLNIILNAFSKIAKHGEGAALQIVFNPVGDYYMKRFQHALQQIQKGAPTRTAINIPLTPFTSVMKAIGDVFKAAKPEEKKLDATPPIIDNHTIDLITRKTSSPILAANIRITASASTGRRAQEILSDITSAFNQFENTAGNKLVFKELHSRALQKLLKAYSLRMFLKENALPMNTRELTSLMHLPSTGIRSSSQFKQTRSGTAPVSREIPQEGTLLGTNVYKGVETPIYLSDQDRMRHLYIVGQTGTGKTTFLKNLIAQDIARGAGVCMIDPHGTDIQDVLSYIPKERYDDVIYFDPSYTKRVMSLNMLEYDPAFPEQKTFVLNELFSIFQKLYGAVPESMGPMFEQYFRNATLLVLEDPTSGTTLLDVSRVLSDAKFRALKLSKCANPVVKQFWEEIAGKAGGDSSLQNIVPYITSKFDVFMANDIMRPLISQEQSSFNFRQIMDERKILLVNLSKGKLGDINANLLGLIVVGKILMATLSRVDAVGSQLTPFYFYIDEFQNVTTSSISTILSEARKYQLSLTIAHQFIAQLQEGIKDAVFGNVGSLAAFRVGPDDAEFLAKQFEPVFSAHDLMNVDNRKAFLRMLSGGRPVKPFNIDVPAPPMGNFEAIEQLKELSYLKYGRDRLEVERDVLRRYGAIQ